VGCDACFCRWLPTFQSNLLSLSWHSIKAKDITVLKSYSLMVLMLFSVYRGQLLFSFFIASRPAVVMFFIVSWLALFRLSLLLTGP
jgi:hypothetical protein